MLDIGWAELFVMAVIALLVVGPKELPAMLRTIGKFIAMIKRQAQEIQSLGIRLTRNSHVIERQHQVLSFYAQAHKAQLAEQSPPQKVMMYQESPKGPRKPSPSPQKISLTQRQRSGNKSRDNRAHTPLKKEEFERANLEGKAELLRKQANWLEQSLKQVHTQNRQIAVRLEQLDSKVNHEGWNMLRNCKTLLEEFLESAQHRIDSAEKNFSHAGEVKSKISLLREELFDIRSQVDSFQSKEFTYDSFQLQLLEDELERLRRMMGPAPVHSPTS